MSTCRRAGSFLRVGLYLLGFLASEKVLPITLCAQELEPLAYNHPGLVVDLGVGLWAWPIPCDADGDGDFDLIVSCPDKPSNGVWFFENTQGDTRANPMPVFKPAVRLSKTVHYVMPSYIGEELRVLSPGYEYSRFTRTGLEERIQLPIDAKFHKPQGKQPKGPKVRHNQWRYVDYDGDGKLDLCVGIEDWSYYGWDDAWNSQGEWQNGKLHGWIYIFRNRGTSQQPEYDDPFFVEADGQRLDVFGCPSPNFHDFDQDGDLDLICGEFLDGFTYFENLGERSSPRYGTGRRLVTDRQQPLVMDLEMIVPVAFDWDRDGDHDLIVGDEDGRVAFVENLGLRDRTPYFATPRYFQQQADRLKCGALASPVGCDWDSDGDIDLVSGNTAGYLEFFENLSGAGVAQPRWNSPRRLQVHGRDFRIMAGPNGSIQGPAEAKWGYTTLNVADWDGDGLLDIVLNSILGKVLWLKNIGSRQQPVLADPQPVEVAWEGKPPELAWGWLKPQGHQLQTQWRTTPLVYDFNADGLVDLAMLDQEGYLAFFERSRQDGKLLLKPPVRAFVDEAGLPLRLNAGTAGKSGRRKLCVTDWNGDGQFDLLLNSANAELMQQLRFADGRWWMKSAGSLASRNIEGHDVSPTVVDFDGDRIPDFVGGAEDGRMYFLPNPRRRDLSPLVRQEFIYERAPFPSCHASTIVETDTGTLVAAWFGGTAEKNPDVGIWLSRYQSGVWTPPVEVANGTKHFQVNAEVARYPTWNPVLFQPQHPTRRLPLMLFYKVGPSPQEWWGMVMTSNDDGVSWSEPVRLPDEILGPIRNKPVQLPDGAILSPSSTESKDSPSQWQVHFEKSTDYGVTWKKIGPLNDGLAIQAIQPAVLFLPGKTLLAVGRTRQDRIFELQSRDAGETWGRMELGSLPNNNSGLDAVSLRDGRHAMVYNHVGGTPGKWGGKRTPLNLSISNDGQLWQAAMVLESEPGEYSYPAIIQTKDGMVHVTYTWRREKIKHCVIDPSRLSGRPIVEGEWPK
jgi:predicted neuraminidase